MVIILIILFTIDLVLSSIYQDKYFLGFFFFLDFLSLISMFLDIHWVNNALIDPNQNTYPTDQQISDYYNTTTTFSSRSQSGSSSISQKGQASGAANAASLARVTRGARVGSRAIRILRILRLVR